MATKNYFKAVLGLEEKKTFPKDKQQNRKLNSGNGKQNIRCRKRERRGQSDLRTNTYKRTSIIFGE